VEGRNRKLTALNILIIDNSIDFTGAFKCALNEAEILSDEHRFVFLIPEGSGVQALLSERNYTVYTLPLKEIRKSVKVILQYPFYLVRNLVALKKIIRTEKIDVVQVNDFYNLLGAALKATGFPGKLLTYVRFLPSVMPSTLRKFWLSLAQKYSHKIIAVSNVVLCQLPRSEKCMLLYDPAKLQEVYPNKRNEERQELRLLYLSNFMDGKGHNYAINAFVKAYEQNKSLRLKFVGGDMGLLKNRAFKNQLIDQTRRLNLESVIQFENFTSDIEKEIKNADVVLNFSDGESFSMTCLEASFFGLPVVATKCGGPEEIIQDMETGYLVEKGDISAMSDAILKMAADGLLRRQMGENARAYVREKFNVAQFRKQFLKALEC